LEIFEDPDGWCVGENDSPFEFTDSGEPETLDPLSALTPKQREVLDLLIEHKTSKEISRLLGISPHTVDQRIMFARSKLNVNSRGEVAQVYRRLVEVRANSTSEPIYEQSIYGFPHVAPSGQTVQSRQQEDVTVGSPALAFGQLSPVMAGALGTTQGSLSGGGSIGQPYHHVLPEMFDGPYGTLLRLGAIALIAAFLILVVMGGLAMYVQLSQMIDR
jgi:DNA-binding CsgD family transcriptional regulator